MKMRVLSDWRNALSRGRVMHKRREVSQPLQRIILQSCLALLFVTAVTAQSTGPISDPVLTRQLHRALSLSKQGDSQGAMKITVQLLQQNPRFAPALKLKGMLLEESGKRSEAAASYEEALRFAPNDPDLLLKSGIYKLATGDRNEAIKRLQHCTKILPDDGDAQYYLAQAYHLNGQDEFALSAIRRSLRIEPDNPSVLQKYGELQCATGDCQNGLR